MPAMSSVASRRQGHAGEAVEFLKIALGQRAAPHIESVQAAQLIDTDLCRDVGEVALGAGKHDIHFAGGIALDAVEAVLLE